MTYDEAKREAQQLANLTGYDHGVERDAFGYHHFMLPTRAMRFGHELRCEVVSCTTLAHCRPGHGPVNEERNDR